MRWIRFLHAEMASRSMRTFHSMDILIKTTVNWWTHPCGDAERFDVLPASFSSPDSQTAESNRQATRMHKFRKIQADHSMASEFYCTKQRIVSISISSRPRANPKHLFMTLWNLKRSWRLSVQLHHATHFSSPSCHRTPQFSLCEPTGFPTKPRHRCHSLS